MSRVSRLEHVLRVGVATASTRAGAGASVGVSDELAGLVQNLDLTGQAVATRELTALVEDAKAVLDGVGITMTKIDVYNCYLYVRNKDFLGIPFRPFRRIQRHRQQDDPPEIHVTTDKEYPDDYIPTIERLLDTFENRVREVYPGMRVTFVTID